MEELEERYGSESTRSPRRDSRTARAR